MNSQDVLILAEIIGTFATTLTGVGTLYVILTKLPGEKRAQDAATVVADAEVAEKRIEIEERRQSLYEKAINDLMERDQTIVALNSRVAVLEAKDTDRNATEELLRGQIRSLTTELRETKQRRAQLEASHQAEVISLKDRIKLLEDQILVLQQGKKEPVTS